MEILKTENIVKDYQGHRALDNVSINVPKGSIFGLLGPNGAGKTTLIRIINQITAPDTGKVIFNGRPSGRNDIYNIGYLPEERGLYKKMKVGEQALYFAQLKGLSYAEANRRLKHWFKKFEITDWWNKKVEELSKGMQQKVQFIITVLHEPELLIFDEPFSGFDPINVNQLKNEILELRDKGATVIFSTHNMASVEELCDHISLIHKSKTILSGSVNEVIQNYKSDIISVVFNGDEEAIRRKLDGGFNIIEINTNGEGKEARIQIPEKESVNNLISGLLPLVTIRSLNEVIPSMNDIFIKVVESSAN
ncbi:ABC transporter ATP-binding protein [Bacteroidota bacterium]